MTNFISSTLAVQLRNTKIFKLEGKTRENEMFLLTSLYDLHAQCEWGVFMVKQYSCVDVSFYADKLWKSKMSTDLKKKKRQKPPQNQETDSPLPKIHNHRSQEQKQVLSALFQQSYPSSGKQQAKMKYQKKPLGENTSRSENSNASRYSPQQPQYYSSSRKKKSCQKQRTLCAWQLSNFMKVKLYPAGLS